MIIFGTMLPLGYLVRRRSAGIYLMMSGMIFLALIAFLPFNPTTLIMILTFAGYISMLGAKKTFFTKM
jgi:small-conductance mechanosensitive channel